MKSGWVSTFAIVLALSGSAFASSEYRCDLNLYKTVPAFMSGRATWDESKPLMQKTFEGFARETSGALAAYNISWNGKRLEQLIVTGEFSTYDGGKLNIADIRHQIFIFGEGLEKDESWGHPIQLQSQDNGVIDLGEYTLTTQCETTLN